MPEDRNEPVYKQLSTDMRNGLRDIYQQITLASRETRDNSAAHDAPENARDLFREATSQLDEVLKATEDATMKILEIVEKQQALQEESSAILQANQSGLPDDAQLERLRQINSDLGNDLTTLTMTLSFQDLTGQRIKRVVSALNKIEDSVVNLYVTSGLIMEGAEQNPGKDVAELKDEANRVMADFRQQRVQQERMNSKLKGPDKNGMSQGVIDDMLAQLGM